MRHRRRRDKREKGGGPLLRKRRRRRTRKDGGEKTSTLRSEPEKGETKTTSRGKERRDDKRNGPLFRNPKTVERIICRGDSSTRKEVGYIWAQKKRMENGGATPLGIP